LLIARHHGLMDDHRIGKVLMAGGWMIVLVVSAVSLYFLWQEFGSAL
jgi:Mn2+/Fe2+ NRAMP family transporter